MKLSRKLKKGLKKAVLKKIDSDWKTSELRLNRVEHFWNYKHKDKGLPVFKNKVVTAYSLG
ncbi:hypothetical protein [Patiriisocius marinus]|uniref:hypothetical protein n=1 Tax=Patiriisocius marinus TaxID=1397112 RepID=UPI00232F69E5|nr:hypothetical protein [Patiriisocius marinus]